MRRNSTRRNDHRAAENLRGPRPIAEAVAELLGAMGIEPREAAVHVMPRNQHTWPGGCFPEAAEASLRPS